MEDCIASGERPAPMYSDRHASTRSAPGRNPAALICSRADPCDERFIGNGRNAGGVEVIIIPKPSAPAGELDAVGQFGASLDSSDDRSKFISDTLMSMSKYPD